MYKYVIVTARGKKGYFCLVPWCPNWNKEWMFNQSVGDKTSGRFGILCNFSVPCKSARINCDSSCALLCNFRRAVVCFRNTQSSVLTPWRPTRLTSLSLLSPLPFSPHHPSLWVSLWQFWENFPESSPERAFPMLVANWVRVCPHCLTHSPLVVFCSLGETPAECTWWSPSVLIGARYKLLSPPFSTMQTLNSVGAKSPYKEEARCVFLCV